MRELAIADAFRSAVAWFDPRLPVLSTPRPANLDDDEIIRELARIHGVRIRRVRLRQEGWWRSAVAPILAFTKNHRRPIALIPSRYSRYEIPRPEEIDLDAFQLYPRLPSGSISFWQLLRAGFVRREKDAATLLMIVGVAALLGAAFPLLAYARPNIFVVMLAVLLLAMTEAAGRVGALRLQGKLKVILVPGIWDRLLRTGVSFFHAFSPPKVASAAGGMEDLCGIVTSDAAVLAGAIGAAGATALAMAMIAARAALAITGAVVLAIFARIALQAAEIITAEPLQDAEQRNSFFLRSLVWDLPLLRLVGADSALCASYIRALNETVARTLGVRRLGAWRAAVAAATPPCALLALACSGAVDRSALAAMLVGAAQLAAAAAVIEEKGGAAIRLRQILLRLRPMLTAPVEPEVPAARTFKLHGAIRADHLTFRWPESQVAALEDVSLNIDAGEFITLAGPSGSGKSTLIRLLLGLDKPSGGGIEYDGQSLPSLDTETHRSQIEVILQDQRIADGSIRTNLIGQSSHSLEDAWEAARLACVDDEIAAMPMGMQTFASDCVLSAGQRQRLLLARAIVRRPAILILDESLSGLDEQLQHRIIANLRGIPGMTCIVASHRPSMTTLMDRTYRLERGRIAAVEQGSPEPGKRDTRSEASSHPEIPGLYRPEAVERFESAEPLDRLVVLS